MSQIAKRSEARAPALTSPPMTGWLRSAVRDVMAPHPDAGPAPLREGVREEAARAAAVLEATMRPATIDDWRRFLLPVVAGCANPPDRDAFAGRVAAIAGALAEVPAEALTIEAQRQVMRSVRFFPVAADLWPILHPTFAGLQAELSVLRRIAAAPAAPAQVAPSAEERAEMARQAAALAAELRAGAEEREARGRPQGRAVALSDGALLAHYERLAEGGSAAAAARARHLRDRIGAAQVAPQAGGAL
jgi:hypothetical protein